MRLLVLLLCAMSFSSCFALGVGALVATLAGTGSRADAKVGAAREAQARAVNAQEAAVIRKRYNEAEARSRAAASPEPEAAVTPPPLVPFEPVRTPLRPKDR